MDCIATLTQHFILHYDGFTALALVHNLLHHQKLVILLRTVQMFQFLGRILHLFRSILVQLLFVVTDLTFLALILFLHLCELLLQILHFFFFCLFYVVEALLEELLRFIFLLLMEHGSCKVVFFFLF